MTIATTTARNQYLGNSVTATFPYTFRIIAATDLVVTRRSAGSTVETTLSYPADYSVSGVGNTSGGSVTINSVPATNDVITIRRVLPITQTTSIRNAGSYFPETHENVFDKGIMIDQQQQEQITRTFQLPSTLDPTTFTMTLPTPVAGQVLTWGTNGLTNSFVSSPNVVLPGAGRTTTTLTEYLANNYVHNVVDYDADPLGIVDSSAAIQAAIQAAVAVNGAVYFPIGTYLASNIQATGGISTSKLLFAGAGPGSVVKLKDGSATALFFVTGIGAVAFSDLTLDGNRANCPAALQVIRSDVSDTMVRSCKIMNGNQDAVFITPDGTSGPLVSTRATVVGNHFLNCGNAVYGGVAVAAEQVQGLVVANNVCDTMGAGLCDIEPVGAGALSDSVVIIGNTVRNSQGWGITGAIQVYSDNASNPLGTGSNAVDHFVISGNVVHTNLVGVGIYVQSSRRGLITGNYVYAPGTHGIHIDGDAGRESKYISVVGNQIVDPSAAASGSDGIRLTNAMNCVVSNNTVVDTRGVPLTNWAVHELGTSNNNWFGPVFALGGINGTFSLVGATPGTIESAGPWTHDGLLRVRNQAATRYRGDLNRNNTGLHIVAFDDTAAVYQPIFADSELVETVQALGTTATPSVAGGNKYTVAASGTAVTDFSGTNGQTIRLYFTGIRTITNNATIVLKGGVNLVGAAGNAVTLSRIAGVWQEDTRNF